MLQEWVAFQQQRSSGLGKFSVFPSLLDQFSQAVFGLISMLEKSKPFM